jgi:hypothetical protein
VDELLGPSSSVRSWVKGASVEQLASVLEVLVDEVVVRLGVGRWEVLEAARQLRLLGVAQRAIRGQDCTRAKSS